MQNVKIEPFNVIGIKVRTTNENGKAATDIAELWNQFLAGDLANKIPNKIENAILSLYLDYEGDHLKPYTAMLGCKVAHLNDIPKNMVGKSIDGGKYVKISARGDLTNGMIVNQWTKIWEMPLDRTFTVDFEVFGEKAQNPKDAEVDFMIAVN